MAKSHLIPQRWPFRSSLTRLESVIKPLPKTPPLGLPLYIQNAIFISLGNGPYRTDQIMSANLKVGMAVEVTHINGIEIGGIESINYKSGKVVIAFNTGAQLNFCTFNISQVKAVA